MATVGIFSDLRDRIRIEQRLLQAQKKLEMTREQAVLGEVAGAAAHELNQPLQSIIGYTELIQRQSEPDAPHARAVRIIMREAERMALIVRKIGEITKYETTKYIGQTNIIDLDRSSYRSGDRAGIVFPASDAAFDGVVEDEFEDEHQITIAQVDIEEVLPPADDASGGAGAAGAPDDAPGGSADGALDSSADGSPDGEDAAEGERDHAGRTQ